MATELEELVSFLSSPSPQVINLTNFSFFFIPLQFYTFTVIFKLYFCSLLQITKAAVDIVRGLTGSEEGIHSLANQSKNLISALSRLLTAPKVKTENTFV